MPIANEHVHIEQLEVFGRVGLTEDERAKPQRLVFNLTAWPRTPFGNLHDEVADAIDYAALAAAVREFIPSHSARLIETVAANLAAHLLKNFPMRKIDIELRKFILPDAQYVSVALSRESSP